MNRDNVRFIDLDKLQENIKYKFKNLELLKLAFIHTSYSNENLSIKGKNNERLEFLGDAVLELVFSEIIYKNFSLCTEGKLTKIRSNLVCENSFSRMADKLDLPKYLLLGKGEEKTGGREKPSIKADLFEAFNGALYLDSDYQTVYEFIYDLIKELIDEIKDKKNDDISDYKTQLQEYLHKRKNVNCVYELCKEVGPSHDKIFYVNVKISNKIIGFGTGKSKKLAEQSAAQNALEKFNVI